MKLSLTVCIYQGQVTIKSLDCAMQKLHKSMKTIKGVCPGEHYSCPESNSQKLHAYITHVSSQPGLNVQNFHVISTCVSTLVIPQKRLHLWQ